MPWRPYPVPNHPRWCENRDQCAERGAHAGRLTEIRTASGDQAAVTVQLAQAVLVGDPYIVVRGDAGHVVLTIRQARALAFELRTKVRRAGESDG